jgi:hypothetical protein
MWRHGDVLIEAVKTIPGGRLRRPELVLAEGEATGYCHRIDRAGATELLDRGATLYVRVLAETATVMHQDRRPITLPRGLYQVWRQPERSSFPFALCARQRFSGKPGQGRENPTQGVHV